MEELLKQFQQQQTPSTYTTESNEDQQQSQYSLSDTTTTPSYSEQLEISQSPEIPQQQQPIPETYELSQSDEQQTTETQDQSTEFDFNAFLTEHAKDFSVADEVQDAPEMLSMVSSTQTMVDNLVNQKVYDVNDIPGLQHNDEVPTTVYENDNDFGVDNIMELLPEDMESEVIDTQNVQMVDPVFEDTNDSEQLVFETDMDLDNDNVEMVQSVDVEPQLDDAKVDEYQQFIQKCIDAGFSEQQARLFAKAENIPSGDQMELSNGNEVSGNYDNVHVIEENTDHVGVEGAIRMESIPNMMENEEQTVADATNDEFMDSMHGDEDSEEMREIEQQLPNYVESENIPNYIESIETVEDSSNDQVMSMDTDPLNDNQDNVDRISAQIDGLDFNEKKAILQHLLGEEVQSEQFSEENVVGPNFEDDLVTEDIIDSDEQRWDPFQSNEDLIIDDSGSDEFVGTENEVFQVPSSEETDESANIDDEPAFEHQTDEQPMSQKMDTIQAFLSRFHGDHVSDDDASKIEAAKESVYELMNQEDVSPSPTTAPMESDAGFEFVAEPEYDDSSDIRPLTSNVEDITTRNDEKNEEYGDAFTKKMFDTFGW